MRRTRRGLAAVACGGMLAAAPAAGQGIRTVAEGAEEAPIGITAQVRHTTTIVLPREEAIADVVAGDAEYWDVSAAENVAYVKPLEAGVASNVTLVAESGRVWALLVAESSDEEPDLVVYVDGPERPSPADAPRHAPAFVAGGELAALQAEEETARAELQAIDEAAAEEVAAVWMEHDAAWARWRDEYPRRLRFPYRLDGAAFGPPFEVEALWHDGRFTYLRSRAQESPALYELHEADRRLGRRGLVPSLVAYEVHDDGLYVADHVLGPGRLRIGGLGDRVDRRPGRAAVDVEDPRRRRRDARGRGGGAGRGDGAMRAWALAFGCVLLGGSAAAQGLRAPAAAGDEPVTVTARVRHVSAIVLPETAEIVDVVVGDGAQWDVSAAAHLAFVRPLVEGARSNLVLLTAAGAVLPLALVESADGPVDAVVRIGSGAEPGAGGPALAPADAVAAVAARAAEAWEAVAAAETRAAERIEAARTAAQAALDARREAYPREARFDYRWPAEASGYPWMVEGMWHDGRRTYLRTRAIAPVLYERVGGELAEVTVSAVLDDVLRVVPRVLGAGALEVGGERLAWTARPRKAGP